jgi:hypothetical protein
MTLVKSLAVAMLAVAMLGSMALRPAQATFFPGPSGSCCNQFGGGGSQAIRPTPLTSRYIACLRAERAKHAAMFNNATIAIQRCRGVR